MKKIFTLAATALATSAFAAIDSVPESATVETWYFSAQVFYPSEKVVNKEIQVAIDGNDLYFTGLSENFMHVWAKGSLENGTYVFAKDQDMGMLWGSYPVSFAGYDYDNWVPTVATAQLADGVLTFNTAIGYYYNESPDNTIMSSGWEAGATMSKEPVEVVEPVLTDAMAALPYKNSFDSQGKRDQVVCYSPNRLGWDWGANWDTNNWYATCYNDGYSQSDAYLVFPGLDLQVGTTYVLSFDAQSSTSSSYQYYEVIMGTEAKLSKLTEAVIPSTYFYGTDWKTVEKEFTVAQSGTYYVAIHCTSYAYSGYFNVDNYALQALDMEKPSPAQNLSITPGSNGALEASIAFTLPKTTISGAEYASDKELTYTVTRDGVIVAEGSGKAGGMVITSDKGEGLEGGHTTYKVTVYDGNHVSKEVEATAFIGLDYPSDTEYIEITSEGNMVTIAWVPVTRGLNGGYVGAKYNVYKCPGKYQVYNGEKLNDEPLTECSYTFEYDVESGEQGEVWFAVTAVNEKDESYGAYASLSVGAPYELPFHESFANGGSNVWSFEGFNQCAGYIDTYDSFSSDGDGCSVCFYSYNWDTPSDGYAVLTSGKIKPAANAELTVDYKAECASTLAIDLVVNGDPMSVVYKELEVGEGTIIVPNVFEQALNDPFVNIAFTASMSQSYYYLYIDNIDIKVVDVPTGISELQGESPVKMYDLSGKLLNARPAAGLYIQNGQKRMIK